MKRIIVVLVFILSFLFSCKTSIENKNKSITEEQIFLNEIIGKQYKDSVFYTKEPFSFNETIKLKYKNLNIFNNTDLTPEEQNYILEKASAQKSQLWTNNIIKKSKMISKDELITFLNKKNKPYFDEMNSERIQKDTSATVKLKNKHFYVFSFSKPVFLRNGNVCLFSIEHNSSQIQSYYYNVALYKKINNKWIHWVDLADSLN